MNEENVSPSVTEIGKSTVPTLLQRFGSLTGTKKLTKEIEALKLKISHLEDEINTKSTNISNLTKKAEERQGEIDQYESNKSAWENRISDLECDINTKSTNISNLSNEVEERKREIDQYKRKIDDENEKWGLKLDAVKADVQSKSTEIEYLKKSEAELKCQLNEMKSEIKAKSEAIENIKTESQDSKKKLELEVQSKSTEIEKLKSRISQLEDENKSKSAKIENLNLEMSQNVQKILEKMDKTSIDLQSHNMNKDSFVTFISKFTGISKLSSTNRAISPPTEIAGAKWWMELQKNGDYIHVEVVTDKICSAAVQLLLVSQKNQIIVHTKRGPIDPMFISFKDLFDKRKGYVKDDSIILSAIIKAFPDAIKANEEESKDESNDHMASASSTKSEDQSAA